MRLYRGIRTDQTLERQLLAGRFYSTYEDVARRFSTVSLLTKDIEFSNPLLVDRPWDIIRAPNMKEWLAERKVNAFLAWYSIDKQIANYARCKGHDGIIYQSFLGIVVDLLVR